ncbi:MAG TPA: DNA polymerase I [bacterium]|nr:DNA polymerase I [bacterium]
MKKKIFIIDSHSLIYKAYYAIQNLTDSKGNSTNAIYGFVKMLIKITETYKPEYLLAVFDISKKSFRTEIYSEYKATRKPTPADLIPQFSEIKNILKKMNVDVIELQNYEADDIIGTLVNKYKQQFEIFIFSSDKDLNQLIDDNVKILNSKKGISEIDVIDKQAFVEKYKIPLESFVDYLALIGDSSDNIPGVEGIGPKFAEKLINEFGSIDNIYANIDKIKPEALRNKLLKNKDNAYLSRQLVKINNQLNLNIELKKFEINNINAVLDDFKRLEFFSIIKELKLSDAAADDTDKKNSVKSEKLADGFKISEITGASQFDNLDIKKNFFVYIAKLNNNDVLYFVNSANIFYFAVNDNMLKKIYEFITANKIRICGYDLKILLKLFIQQKLNINDLIIFDYRISYSMLHKDEDIYSIILKLFSIDINNIDNLEFENIDLFQKSITENLQKQICNFFKYYTALEDLLTAQLKETNQLELFENLEIPLLTIVAYMEFYGISVDKEYLLNLKKTVSSKVNEISANIYKELGEEINLNSPKQIADALYNKLGLIPQRKIKTGYSTDNETLLKLRHFHIVPELLLEYRKFTKILSGYILPLIEHIHSDGKIHCNFNQTGATTGRFSSNNPNLQNLPTTHSDILNIRRAFKSYSNKYLLVNADYSQIELRIIAHLSNDEYMINAFINDEDIHTSTAKKIFDINDAAAVTQDMRRLAKTINFGVLYGMSAHSLAMETGLFHNQAKAFIDNYFNQFSSIKKYFDNLIFDAKKNGYVETLFKRRRYIPELLSKNKVVQQSGIRMAMNMPIQGTAADILKLAMLKTRELCDKYNAQCILTIHDELVFEIPKNSVNDFAVQLKQTMENIIKLNVPLKAEVNIASRLDELK